MKRKIKILYIENDPFLREMYQDKFRKAGFVFKTLTRVGKNFLDRVVKIQPDLISLSIILRGIDGYEALRMLKADRRTRDIPVFIASNLGTPKDIEKSLRLGAIDHLVVAQYTPSELVQVYAKYLSNPAEYWLRRLGSSDNNLVTDTSSSSLVIPLGRDYNDKEIVLDFAEIGFMILVGATGTGKSIFHSYLYKRLSEQNTPKEIGFIFLDMTRCDFGNWQAPYVMEPIIVDANKAITFLEKLSKEKPQNRKIFIHIEECNMFVVNTKKMEHIIKTIKDRRKDICLIYSTSRPAPPDALSKTTLNMADAKMVFELASKQDLKHVLGKSSKYMPRGWQRIAVVGSQKILLKPFSNKDVKQLQDFHLS